MRHCCEAVRLPQDHATCTRIVFGGLAPNVIDKGTRDKEEEEEEEKKKKKKCMSRNESPALDV